MDTGNQSSFIEFLLLGFSDFPDLWMLIFAIFLSLYLITLLGNIIIISVILLAPQLHTPMYLFLCNLSLVDMGFTSVTVPKLLANLLLEKRTISFNGCITQMMFFIFLGNMESNLLAVMAYDRYVAISDPLHYATAMDRRHCLQLLLAAWASALAHSLLHTAMASRLSFCGPITIHHFFCEISLFLKLSCSDTTANEMVIFTEGAFSVMGPFIFIVTSYICIMAAILRIRSTEGRRKAFSTCFSHLIVVILFYGTIFSIYFRPSLAPSVLRDRMVSVMHTVLAPMLNPIIYSLKNEAVKGALRKICYPNI
ncbi:olfactory receptor 1361-like [Rhinatrema bivittatum]|uniref:olfactory receptor 1361-like n=1 Tax=Rhinatrema bivittatum TaxID=194408 RepID=UPI00112DDC40|nr:olfactory receptor 1361-like [Rhinatrema bivittatum]